MNFKTSDTKIKKQVNPHKLQQKHKDREFVVIEQTENGPKVHRFIGDKFGILRRDIP